MDDMIERKRNAILKFLEMAKSDLDVAEAEKNLEGVAAHTYMVGEYEQMLEEFDEYYGL